ncbi:hypothetical protein ACOI7N_10330 [Pseudomonas sp. P2758]
MIQAFRGDFWVTTEFSGDAKIDGAIASRDFHDARLLPVCEGARFYQA